MQLGDLCELIVDCEHKTAPTQETGYPSIRTPNIGRGYFLLDGVNRVSEETYRLWTRRAIPQPGDLIMAREAPVGNVAMIPHGLQPCLGQRTLLIRPDDSKADSRYLAYLLVGDEVQAAIHAMTNGATVAHLNMKDVRALALPPIPALRVQQEIASILSAYDDLIENNTRRIQILEQMAQALYREWFVNFRFPGHAKVKPVESSMGKLPQGWVAATFGCMADISRTGINPQNFPDEHFWHYSIPAFDVGQMPLLEKGATILSNKFLVEADCVLLSKLNPRIPRVWLPRIGTSHRALASTEFLVFKTRPSFSLAYLFCLCTSSDFLSVFAGRALGTSTSHQRVKPDDLLKLPVVLPASALVQGFTESVTPILTLIHIIRLKNANLRRTRDLLLPKLMSGALDVSKLDIETA